MVITAQLNLKIEDAQCMVVCVYVCVCAQMHVWVCAFMV